MMSLNSFNTRREFDVGGKLYSIYDLRRLPGADRLKQLPYSIKILLENLLRCEDGRLVRSDDIEALYQWQPGHGAREQIAFTPARVVLQDFTGVPAMVDLAAMRDAIGKLGGDPAHINPIEPVDLVIDHSVMVDYSGGVDALQKNTTLEFERNRERYQFLRWGQEALANFRVVPPGTGIVHQVNLEYLAHVVMTKKATDGSLLAYPDTLVGTDSHTTMINGLGVLGWGVGGIEAEAAMLGQPVSMLLPEVVGFQLEGDLPDGATATDLVLTVTQMLRAKGVVGKFVEFFGDGLRNLPLADRATIANMAPEYGATCGIFPIDQETLKYLRLSGRKPDQIALIEAYAKAQSLWRQEGEEIAQYSDHLHLNLGDVVPSLAGPKRPQDRIALTDAKTSFIAFMQAQGLELTDTSLSRFDNEGGTTAIGAEHPVGSVEVSIDGQHFPLSHGDIVIAAITSCTNTSNPAVMIAAGLVAKNALEMGLQSKPWVKTSLAPGSQVVPAYLASAGLLEPLSELGFDLVGFGCTTCIGNSGPLAKEISDAILNGQLTVCSVLSGNRNFEGRIHPEVRANYLASPPLVVAYALAGTMNTDLVNDSLGINAQGKPVFLRDIWPSQQQISELIASSVVAPLYQSQYQHVFAGSEQWQSLPVPEGKTYSWPASTYIKNPPYFVDMPSEPVPQGAISGARCLVKVGDSITTDHISPAGAIHVDSPAGRYLQEQGVVPKDFNSLGSRRGNHEVMMRGTFANPRLRNQLAPGTEGGFTCFFPDQEITTIYDAAMRYQHRDTPLIVIAGKEYGTGSSRDWAAKGVNLLGVRAVIAQSFERIHRANLVGFGVLPLEFQPGEDAATLRLTGDEEFSIPSVEGQPNLVLMTALRPNGDKLSFNVRVRIDTPAEWDYYRHGGILHFVLRQLAKA